MRPASTNDALTKAKKNKLGFNMSPSLIPTTRPTRTTIITQAYIVLNI